MGVLSQMVEVPSFLWNETLPTGRSELVRLTIVPTDERPPRRVKAICLPFVFVKLPCGQHQTIDVRLTSLVRLERSYARKVWKALRSRPQARNTCEI